MGSKLAQDLCLFCHIVKVNKSEAAGACTTAWPTLLDLFQSSSEHTRFVQGLFSRPLHIEEKLTLVKHKSISLHEQRLPFDTCRNNFFSVG
jgi:hypothetical protein